MGERLIGTGKRLDVPLLVVKVHLAKAV